MYNDAWRTMRDWFYDPNLHGVDWRAMRDKYGVMIPHVANREDFTFLLRAGERLMPWQRLAERGGDPPRVTRARAGCSAPDSARPRRAISASPKSSRRELAGVFPLAAHRAGVKAKVGD